MISCYMRFSLGTPGLLPQSDKVSAFRVRLFFWGSKMKEQPYSGLSEYEPLFDMIQTLVTCCEFPPESEKRLLSLLAEEEKLLWKEQDREARQRKVIPFPVPVRSESAHRGELNQVKNTSRF